MVEGRLFDGGKRGPHFSSLQLTNRPMDSSSAQRSS
jgi:hypothetical protein